jgi:O-antigen ligase
LVATTSRTGVIALVPGMALVLILDFRRRKSVPWRLLLGLAGLVLVCFAVVAVSTPTKQRARLDRLFISSLLHGQDGSTHARLLALKEAGQIARESHGLGVGLGASYRYWEKTRPHDPNLAPENGQMGHELIMSIWGQLLAEGGIPALLLYAAAAIFLLRTLLAQWRREHDSFSLGSLVAALIFFGFIAFAMGNVARGDVWVWFALWSRMALPDSASLEKA